jgi:hypothetical protein
MPDDPSLSDAEVLCLLVLLLVALVILLVMAARTKGALLAIMLLASCAGCSARVYDFTHRYADGSELTIHVEQMGTDTELGELTATLEPGGGGSISISDLSVEDRTAAVAAQGLELATEVLRTRPGP